MLPNFIMIIILIQYYTRVLITFIHQVNYLHVKYKKNPHTQLLVVECFLFYRSAAMIGAKRGGTATRRAGVRHCCITLWFTCLM